MNLVIAAGGKGTRLGKITKNIPKPMVKIGKMSFLKILILSYSRYNLDKIYLMVGYKSDLIIKFFHNKYFNGVPVVCIKEPKPLGNFGCLSLVKKKLKDKNFIYANADSIIDFNLNDLIKKKFNNSHIILTKHHEKSKNNLNLKKKGSLNYTKKGKFIYAGISIINKETLKLSKSKFQNFEHDTMQNLIKTNKITGQYTKKYFIDIGTHKNLNKYKKKNKLKNKAIFLDRDGTINYDDGYTYKTNKLKIIIKNINKIKEYRLKNKKIFIISNQAGIAKGIFTNEQMNKFYREMKKRLYKLGILIDEYSYCPHHPHGKIKKYRKICKCRKPKNGMIENIIKNWNIDRKNSVFFGDEIKDAKASFKSGLSFILV